MARHSRGDTDLSHLLSEEENDLHTGLEEGDPGLRRRGEKTQRPRELSSGIFSSRTPPVAIFAVNFDDKKGNVLEWSATRNDVDLDGLEFKAFPSGAHLIPSDITIFQFRQYYGIACFETVRDGTVSRGARLKSVGILARDLDQLIQHRPFLKEQVRRLHIRPEFFEEMQQWFDRMTSADFSETKQEITKTIFPDGNAVIAFLREMDAQIFILWKLVMLKKRILFISQPPVERLCVDVLLCSLLDGSADKSDARASRKSSAFFFVDLHDMEKLRLADTYTACSTEKILEVKSDLYDALVVNGKVRIHNEAIREKCCVNSADRRRFVGLLEIVLARSRNDDLSEDSTTCSPQNLLKEFFVDLNESVLSGFHAASSFREGKLSPEDILSMTLDPSLDIPFLSALAELRGFQVELPGGVWCPSCRCC